MPFEIATDISPAELMRYGPVVPGAWQHNDAIVRGKFLIDTGAGGIFVCETVAQKLGLPHQRMSSVHGPTGKASLNQYMAHLQLPAKDAQRRDVLFNAPVECQGVPDLSVNHEAYGIDLIGILGRQFLQFVRLDLNGVTGQVMLHIDDAITRPAQH